MFTTEAHRRLQELQARGHLTPGEAIEVKVLIQMKYAGKPLELPKLQSRGPVQVGAYDAADAEMEKLRRAALESLGQ